VRVILKLIIIFLVLFINLYSEDDEIQFTHLKAEDGLSLNIVTKILQAAEVFYGLTPKFSPGTLFRIKFKNDKGIL
jgi:hypothetical protein